MEKPNFTAFINWGFQALIIAVCAWGVTEISYVRASIQELNVKIAVVVERDAMRGGEIIDLKARVLKLEDRPR